MSSGKLLVRALRSLLAIASGFIVVVLVNQGGGELGDLIGFAGGGGRRLAWDLGWVFIAGTLAAWVAVRLAPCARRAHAAMFFAAMLAVAAWGVTQMGDDWPRWFSAGVLIAVPLQVGLGTCWALRGGSRGASST